MNTNKIIKTGLLAYGMSGKIFHAPFIDANEGFELYGIVERTKKIARKDYPNVQSFDSIEAILQDESIELIIVNTPNYLHFEHAKAALIAQKNVLIEKPVSSTGKELEALINIAEENKKQIFYYQNRRWDSDFLSVKLVVESGKLGKINEVHFRFDRYRDTISPKAFKEQPFPASGLLYDLGPHLLDQIISLWGMPEKWHKTLAKNRLNTLVDDYFSIQLTFSNSLNVYVHSNMLVANPQTAFILHGSNGTYTKDRTDQQENQLINGVKPLDKNYGEELANMPGKLVYFNNEKELLTEYIPPIKGNYMQLFDALYLSLTSGTPFPISNEEELIQLSIINEK